jgi:hypothetical protein
MLGVNIGIPVPREPFAFGGMYGTLSKYGDMDITGEGCIEFFSNRRKITSRWPTNGMPALMFPPSSSGNGAAASGDDSNGKRKFEASAPKGEKDVANFNGEI